MEMSDLINKKIVGDKEVMDAVGTVLQAIGEDPDRDGLQRTPERMTKAYSEWFGGYQVTPESALNRTFETDYGGLVLVKDIKFYSHCEHHMAPFFGKVHIAYIPKDKIAGLDKFIKLVEVYARRLQTQEQLTYQIAKAIKDILKPKGVAVQISAVHFCIMSRETRNQDSITTTTKLYGDLKKDGPKNEFFQSIKDKSVF